MNNHTTTSLSRVHIFKDLSDQELQLIGSLCKVQQTKSGETVFNEGDDGHEMFIIQEGCIRISINTRKVDGSITKGTINMLYNGQSFGEMVLLDGVTRSATATSVEPCTLLVLHARDFNKLCEANPRIGYRVMYNLACDVAYKLRSSNLLLRGNIRWQQGELGNRQ